MWSDDEESSEERGRNDHFHYFEPFRQPNSHTSIVINQKFVMDLLYAHDIEKRKKEWTLYPYSDLMSIRSRNYVFGTDITLMSGGSASETNTDMELKDTLVIKFPQIPFLFSLCPENMVLAGGSLATLVNRGYHRDIDDVDFFFHSLTTDEVISTIHKIVDACEKKFPGKMVVHQNRFVTTISIMNENFNEKFKSREIALNGQKYQFIHRSFPNKSSVIGGFDLGASMILMDGDMKTTTNLLGLFSLATMAIFVDIKSTSSSFGYRLFKYHTIKRFSICISRVVGRDVDKKIEDAKNLFGLPSGQDISIKLGENLYGRILICKNKEQVGLHIANNRSEASSDYDTVNAKIDIGISNMIAVANGNYESLIRCGRSWSDLQKSPKIPPLKYLNNHMYKSKSKKVLKNFGSDFEKPERRGDAKLNLELYNTFLSKIEEFGDRCNMYVIGPENNPGRQFTASFHPTNPSEWYNEFIFPRENAPTLGIQWEIVRDLSIARIKGHPLFGPMPRDLLKYLFNQIFISEGLNARDRILKVVNKAKSMSEYEFYQPRYIDVR